MTITKFAVQVLLTIALSGIAGAALFAITDYATKGVIA